MLQVYCRDFPNDENCPRPSCKTYSSMESNVEYCDYNMCDAFMPPVDDIALTPEDVKQRQVCESTCSASRLGPEGTGETLALRDRCRGLCEIHGPSNSVLCLNYCLSYPNDPVCPESSIVNQIAHKPFTVDCLIPDTFANNIEYCEQKVCQPLLWRQDLVLSPTTADPTAADVCTWSCSALNLGPIGLNDTQTNIPQRAKCRDRCNKDGYNSFLCQVCKWIESRRQTHV